MLCRGPSMMVVADTWAHVRHLGAPQGYVPAGDPDFLTNFDILMNDETTREIFPLPPLTSYRRDQNIRDLLVHTSMKSQSGSYNFNFLKSIIVVSETRISYLQQQQRNNNHNNKPTLPEASQI